MFLTSSGMAVVSSIDTPIFREHSGSLFASPTSTSCISLLAILLLRSALEPANKSSIHPAIKDIQTTLSHISDHYMFSCCQKKPKKFESEEQLRYAFVALCHRHSNDIAQLTKTRSCTPVHIATIDSGTRMRLKDTRVSSTLAGNPGLMQQFLLIRPGFNSPYFQPLETCQAIPVVSVAKDFQIIRLIETEN